MPRRPIWTPPDREAASSVLRGMAQVARGRAQGLALFGDTPQAFLASLAPLIAFPLVGSVLLMLRGYLLAGFSGLFGTTCVLLAPAVVSYEFARLWHRQDRWLRFATAFNWCQWLVLLLAMLLALPLTSLQAAGVSAEGTALLFGLLVGGYGLWLHWFLARHGLQLSRLKAVVLVVTVNLITMLLVIGPRLLTMQRG